MLILKSMAIALAPLALMHYLISSIPIIVSAIPTLGWIAGPILSLILWLPTMIILILLQALVIGMYRPISRIALQGTAGIPAGMSFFDLARQNPFALILFSLATSVAVAMGTCALIIPGIIIGIIAQPAGYLVATRGMNMLEAAKAAIDVIKANPIPVLAYHAIAFATGIAITVPFCILIFIAYFGLSFASATVGNLMLQALTPAMYLSIIPVFTFAFGTLYAKLIDANPYATPEFAAPTNNPQQPASGW